MSRARFAGRHSRLIAFLAAAHYLLWPIAAPADSPARLADIAAHPALWTVRSKTATVYLFGSLHLLPANLNWHTPAIDAAIAASDIFVFEAPTDKAGKAAVNEFVIKNGSLPDGTLLSALLSKTGLADYNRAILVAHVARETLDHERPWLADIVLDVAYLQQLHYMVADGVDQQVYAIALQRKKAVRYLETPEQQLTLFVPKDQKVEIAEFEADLKHFPVEQSSIGAMVDAWGEGNAKEVGRLMNKDLNSVPGEKKILIDDRNAAWMKTFAAMLAEHATYFVTVGTGHLVGPHGVPALLRAKGYSVEGP